MTPRIKELAEQAGYIPLPGFDFANELQEVFLNKFAKLIVEECANVADENYIHRGSRTCGLAIRLHFGVGE
jgi:hypothetical protein